MSQQQGETIHSKIGASSMHRWSQCPASVALCDSLPSKFQSEYAKEGTIAHDFAAKWITTGIRPMEMPDEMGEAVKVYVDYCFEKQKLATKHGTEHFFDISNIFPGLFGTSDKWLYYEKESMLEVVDYKHGAGVPVDPEENEQLMYYGLGALISLALPCRTVRLTIVQPRCYGLAIKSWDLRAVDLIDFETDLIAAAKKTEDPNAEFKSGEHCRFCAAQTICPKLREEGNKMAMIEFEEKKVYDPHLLKTAMDFVPRLEAWCKAVREFAYHEHTAGRKVEGYKLVQKRATRKWKDEEQAKKYLLDLGMHPDMIEEKFMRSPAQIEKNFKGKDKSLLEPLVVSQSSGTTLVPADDNRPEVTEITTAHEDFKDVGD